MNPFVNLNKRGVELPQGCKELVDVLRAKQCEYCDEVAIATKGWPGDYRWCEACQSDLAEFARQENDDATCKLTEEAARSHYRADLQRRQDEFMRQRVKERQSHDAA